VASRRAPRGSSSRRQRGGPTGQERSYAGAAQYPCAEHRGGRPRAAPSLPRRRPGLLPGYTCCAPRGHKQLPWVMGCPPHQERRRTVTSPPGPGPSSSTPARPHAGRGGDSHKGVGGGRAVDAAGSGQSGTSPRGPEKSGRDRRASVPRHVESAVTAVTAVVTVHGVKRSRPAGPGAARGPTRRGVPARRGRPDNALRKEKPAACRDQSKRNNGWGRGVARDAATGLEKRRREQTLRWKRSGAAKCSLQVYN
jgi:hypothetical protein